MSFYKEVPGRQTTLESTLKFDTKPTEGSTNPVTSDGVKGAIDGAVGDASEALQEQIDDIAEKAGSGYIPKGEADVATLNGLSGQENGWLYTMTDSGTLTDGSLAVVAGDTVAWDEANSVWYKAMDYAPAQYGTNEVHNLATTATESDLVAGNFLAIDVPGAGGATKKLAADKLLEITTENSVGKRQTSTFTFSDSSYNGSAINLTAVSADADTYFVIENKQQYVDKVTFFSSSWSNLGEKTIPSSANSFSFKIPANTTRIQFHRTGLGATGTATVTMFQGLTFTILDDSDSIKKNASDISALSTHVSDVVVTNFAGKFDDTADYTAGKKVVNNDELYMFVYDHVSGAWDTKDVLKISVADLLGRSETFAAYNEVGISEPGDAKPMISKYFSKDKDTSVYVILPKTLWAMTNIPNTTGNVFVVGYISGGSEVVISQYTRNVLSAGMKIKVPEGYDNFFVKVRGDKDEVIEYTTLSLLSQGDSTKNIGYKFDRSVAYGVGEFVINDERLNIFTFPHAAGAFDNKESLQLPLSEFIGRSVDIQECAETGISESGNIGYMISRTFTKKKEDVVYVALPPSTWNCSNIPNTSGLVFIVGYNENGTDTSIVSYNKSSLASHQGAKIKVPAGHNNFFVKVRGNKDQSIKYNVFILAKLDGSVEDVSHDARNYDSADIIARPLTFLSSDFPSDMKSLSSKNIRAYPIIKNPGDITWGQGFAIASDGMGLVASYGGTFLVLGVFDINDPNYQTYSKAISMPHSVHGNQMWFGTSKYDADDKYPVLYVGGHLAESEASTLECLRIVGDLKDPENLSFTLLQTITFPVSIGQVADAQNIGGNLVTLSGNEINIFGSFPAYNAGDITYTDADITDTFTLNGNFSQPVQSGCVVDGKYYAITGAGQWCWLHLIDVLNKTNKETLMPNYGEWEGLCYYDDMLFATTTQRNYRGVVQQELVCALEFTF